MNQPNRAVPADRNPRKRGSRPLNANLRRCFGPRRTNLMAKQAKVLWRVLSGTADANIRIVDLCSGLIALGFKERVGGSHHIFSRDGVDELINLQRHNNLANVYQVRQVYETAASRR